MADDNNAPYRPNDPSGRAPSQGAPASDPLAELARLIGQNDAFAEYGREPRPPAQPEPDAGYADHPAPSYGDLPTPQYGSDPTPPYSEPAPQYSEPAPRYAEPAPRYSEPAPRYSEPAPRYSEPAPQYNEPAPQQFGLDYNRTPTPRYAADYPPRYSDDRTAPGGWPASPAPPQSYQPADPPPLPPQHAAPPLSAPHYDNQGYANPNYGNQAYADPHGRPPSAGYAAERHGVDAAGYPVAPDRPGYAPPLYPHEPEAGAMPPPHADEFYDDEPRGGRRRGLLTVVAVLGLAVIGTAGAFGYRSLFGSSGSSSPPPVIRASGEPSKVAPPPVTADTSASKFSYDRFGDAGKDEQVVRREEKPVDLAKAGPPPRTVFPGAPVPNSAASKQSATTAGANPPSAIGEPRRVRTVPIRPDQGGETTPAQQPMAAAPQRQAAVTAPAADDPPPAPRASAATRAPTPRVASRQTPSAPTPSANAPLSLAPDANNDTLPPPSAQENFPPPPRASAAPARVASAPASGGGTGSYLVQVSSQRSEADAQSAYRSIQSKYPSVLGSQRHTVRRADLGSKGVYYRAMVGPFPSREAAIQLCSSLKQAGGDCVVQH